MILKEEQRIFGILEQFILKRQVNWKTTTLWDPNITNNTKGVYIVRTKNKVMYVGKGTIRSRLSAHEQKLTGNLRGATMTTKFKQLYEAKLVPPIADIYVVYFECNATERSACEGFLINEFQPPLNDEVECNILEEFS